VFRVESAPPLVFDDGPGERLAAAMYRRDGGDRIRRTPDHLSRLELLDVDRKGETVGTERFASLEEAHRTARAPAAHRLRAALQGERAQQPDHAEKVIEVKVREKNVVEGEGDAIAHHLPLGTLAAIEEERFPFADHGNGGHTALHGGPGGGGTQESNEEGHGEAEYSG
jgi:hypothetical protein